MKHNWEYKTIRSMCDNTPYRGVISSHDGKYWLLNLDKIASGEGKVIEYEYFHDSDILGGSVTTFGKNYVLYSKLRPNLNKVVVAKDSGFCTTELVPLLPDKSLNSYFLAYLLRSPIFLSYITGKVGGAKMPRAKMDAFWSYKIPVPSMEVQERIVSELDEINSVIEAKREQIKQLDLLAQSLFYTMFGDPVSNTKDFDIKLLGNSCEVSSAKRVLVQDVVSEGVPFIRGTELGLLAKQSVYNSDIFTMFITLEHYEKVKAITGVPKVDDLLIPSINAEGHVWQVNTDSPFYFKDGRVLWVHVNHDLYSSKWLRYCLSKVLKEKYASLSRGAVFAELTLILLRNLPVITPPLELQREFAAKVEAIEARKGEIEESVRELQTLLDSRMDYWFN